MYKNQNWNFPIKISKRKHFIPFLNFVDVPFKMEQIIHIYYYLNNKTKSVIVK